MGKQLAVGVLAHVDAGKTTLIEAMLYAAGAIRSQGRVDKGTSLLDNDPMERSRGITIFSKLARFSHAGASVTLVDTPGHVDFCSEAERAVGVLDAAVLVVSGPEGVQGHTRTLWRLLEEAGVPTVVFVNKTDLEGFSRQAVLAGLAEKLSPQCLSWDTRTSLAFHEAAASEDEQAIEEFLEAERLGEATLQRLFSERKLFPVLFGAALHGEGVAGLLDTLAQFVPEPPRGDALAARVYKVSHDASGERLAWVKMEGGTLQVRDTLELGGSGGAGGAGGSGCACKVSQIRLYSADKFQTVPSVQAGQVCAICGLEGAFAGMGIGAVQDAPAPLVQPVLSYQVVLPPGVDATTALPKLRVLGSEDPLLGVSYDEDAAQIRASLMGSVQAEVFCRQVEERFGMAVTLGSGAIQYRETIAAPVVGIGHFEPLRHYAEAHILLEPLPAGTGLQFASACHVDDLDLNWQRLIWEHLVERQHKGVLVGAPLTDVRFTILAGRAHAKHTNGGDFRQATYRAIRQGLMQAESKLLEPWYSFEAQLPSSQVGRLLSDMTAFSATFGAPIQQGDTCTVRGQVPAACMQDYPMDFTAYTHGEGDLRLEAAGYRPCHNQAQVVEERAYNPEADLAHTPDSVFCEHGAGHTVKWRDVPARAHVDSGWPNRPLTYRFEI